MDNPLPPIDPLEEYMEEFNAIDTSMTGLSFYITCLIDLERKVACPEITPEALRQWTVQMRTVMLLLFHDARALRSRIEDLNDSREGRPADLNKFSEANILRNLLWERLRGFRSMLQEFHRKRKESLNDIENRLRGLDQEIELLKVKDDAEEGRIWRGGGYLMAGLGGAVGAVGSIVLLFLFGSLFSYQ